MASLASLGLAVAVLHTTTALTTTYPRCARLSAGAARAALQRVRLAMDGDEDEVSMGAPPKWQSIRPVDEDAANQPYEYEEEEEEEEEDEEKKEEEDRDEGCMARVFVPNNHESLPNGDRAGQRRRRRQKWSSESTKSGL